MLKIYLAGPIHSEDDAGSTWREWIKPRLINMGHEPIDPLAKYDSKVDEERERLNGLLEEDIKKFKAQGWNIIDLDLQMIEEADAVLALYRPDVDSFGTPDEIFYAAYVWNRILRKIIRGAKKKQVWIVCQKKSDNLWMRTLATKFFTSFPAFLDWLKEG